MRPALPPSGCAVGFGVRERFHCVQSSLSIESAPMIADRSDGVAWKTPQEGSLAQLLAPAGMSALVPHVYRVLVRIAEEREFTGVVDAPSVEAVFKTHQLIPPVLFEQLREL